MHPAQEERRQQGACARTLGAQSPRARMRAPPAAGSGQIAGSRAPTGKSAAKRRNHPAHPWARPPPALRTQTAGARVMQKKTSATRRHSPRARSTQHTARGTRHAARSSQFAACSSRGEPGPCDAASLCRPPPHRRPRPPPPPGPGSPRGASAPVGSASGEVSAHPACLCRTHAHSAAGVGPAGSRLPSRLPCPGSGDDSLSH